MAGRDSGADAEDLTAIGRALGKEANSGCGARGWGRRGGRGFIDALVEAIGADVAAATRRSARRRWAALGS